MGLTQKGLETPSTRDRSKLKTRHKMKTVFSSYEIAHVWASQSAPYGRSPGNASFQGKVFRSWQTDIGVILQPGQAVLINSTSYSNSTSKVQGRMRCAVHHFPVKFYVDGLPRGEELRQLAKEPARIHEYCLRAAKEALDESKAPRIRQTTRDAKRSIARGHLEQANAVNDFFRLRKAPVNPDDIGAAVARLVRADAKKAREEEKARQIRAKAEAERVALWTEQSKEALTEWRTGERAEIPHYLGRLISLPAEGGYLGNAALRLSVDGTRVETSQGAQVLVRTVRFLWEFCAHARATKTAVAEQTVSRFPALDYYKVNSIDAFGNVSAGCHCIPFAEVEGVARALNLPPFNGEPAQSPQIPFVETVNS